MRTRPHPMYPWRRIPWPTKAQEREWSQLDDSKPPEGKPDGEFLSFITWVNKAASWIGGTGAKCFDAKDRRCRIGADFMRANDEGAFPVRYYFPDRFKPKWPRPGFLHLNAWGGCTRKPVEVVGETPRRFRIRAVERTQLAGRNRWLNPGEQMLVPKTAVTLEVRP